MRRPDLKGLTWPYMHSGSAGKSTVGQSARFWFWLRLERSRNPANRSLVRLEKQTKAELLHRVVFIRSVYGQKWLMTYPHYRRDNDKERTKSVFWPERFEVGRKEPRGICSSRKGDS